MTAAPPVVALDGVGKRFRGRAALSDVTLRVPRGCIYGLLGPNGAGKTTLFSILAGFLRPDAGTVAVLGSPLGAPELRSRVGVLPQDAQFQADVPIAEQLVFLLELAGRGRATAWAEVDAALARVGLSANALGSARSLSHGMYKRLGIAQAFLADPELVLLDEPTAGLDPANANAIRDLIRASRARDATIVVSSHDLAEMQSLCDEVCILREGRVVSAGPVARLQVDGLRVALRLSRALDADEIAQCLGAPGVAALRPGSAGGVYDVELALAADDPDGDRALSSLLRALLDRGVVPREIGAGNRLERHFAEVTRG